MDNISKNKIVLYCHNDYVIKKGGEYNVYSNDVILLERLGYKVIRYEKNNEELYKANLFKKILFLLKTFFNFSVYYGIKRIIEEEKIEYAFVQNTYLVISPAIYLALYKKGIPIIQMVYNYRFMCANAHLYTQGKICEKCIKGADYNAILNKCVRNSYLISLWYASIHYVANNIFRIREKISAFIVPDEFSKQKHISSSIEKEKIFVAKNPFTLDKSYEYRNEDEEYFLYIGRLIKQKGIYTFLNSAKRLPERQFKIIGEGEEGENVNKFILSNNCKNVDFLGALYGNEMTKVLNKARALIVPSEWYDNYPVVISLAYQYSKPVIATNINGLPEVVINNKTGLLFEPKNVEDLCNKINYLADNFNKAKELGNNGRLFLLTELNVENRIKIIEEVLEYIAKQ